VSADWSVIEALPKTPIVDLFGGDDDRLKLLAHETCGMRFDFAKTHLTRDAIAAFEKLAKSIDFAAKREALFTGAIVNPSEGRAAEHTAQRGEGEDLGFLGARTLVGGLGVTVVQYWRSTEDIYRYAGAPEHAHRPAWAAFNARARTASGAVGIWHETYAVPAGGHESLYVGCAPMGLAAATSVVPAGANGSRARLRRADAGGAGPEGQ